MRLRRKGGVLLAGVLAFHASVTGQSSLPLANLGLEHLDIVVPDPAASARFYARVFRTELHQQPIRDTLRYFVLLGDLPADRQVGYIAIGAGAGTHARDWPLLRAREGVRSRRLRGGIEVGGTGGAADGAGTHRHVARSRRARAAAVPAACRLRHSRCEIATAGWRRGPGDAARRRPRAASGVESRSVARVLSGALRRRRPNDLATRMGVSGSN